MVSLITTLLFCDVYYSKVEPIEVLDIASNVSGQVVFADENSLGDILSEKPYIMIDSELEKKEFTLLKDKIKQKKIILFTNNIILQNLEEY